MQVNVIAVRRVKNRAIAIGRAVSNDATIHIRAEFEIRDSIDQTTLWDRARNQVLRYLDIA